MDESEGFLGMSEEESFDFMDEIMELLQGEKRKTQVIITYDPDAKRQITVKVEHTC